MSKLLFIDSDDIEGLSEALREALERRGVVFGRSEYDYPDEDDEPDIDPYLGNMPPFRKKRRYAEDHSNEKFLFQETGGVIPGSCGGGCGYTPSYGGCGNSHC